MKNIPTDSLRTLITVVEVGGFAKAGELLGLSQPAVSLQIKRLEELLGNKLFKKQGQRQVLNQHGEILMPLAKQLLQVNDTILQTFSSEVLAGKVRLGIPSEFAATVLPSIIGDFVSLYPDVALEVKSELSKKLRHSDNREQYDLILALLEGPEQSKYPIFMDDELVWVGDVNNINTEEVKLIDISLGGARFSRSSQAKLQTSILILELIPGEILNIPFELAEVKGEQYRVIFKQLPLAIESALAKYIMNWQQRRAYLSKDDQT